MTATVPPVFSGLVGQDRCVATLTRAAVAARAIVDAEDDEWMDSQRAMSHAWLITGPPGSGRSVAAQSFAAALQCTGGEPGCGECPGCKTTMNKSNGDVHFISTQESVISVKVARPLVLDAQSFPSQGRWRVMIVEDADRLTEQAANALLKAIEEPPERTIWLLCAPSVDDMIPTIRSRCRHIGLTIPQAQAVADLLVSQGVADPATALAAARAAQSHIGFARALAKDPQMRRRRRDIIAAPIRVHSVAQAVSAAEELLATAKAQADAQVEQINAREKAELLRQLGLSESDSPTKQSRTMVRELQENQKRRAKRALKDELDRALIDLLAIYRDILMVQLGTGQELVNEDLRDLVDDVAQRSTASQTMARVSAIEDARRRLQHNGQATLVLEAMIVALRLDS